MHNNKLLSLAYRVKKWLLFVVLSKLAAMLLNIVIILNTAAIIEKFYTGQWSHKRCLICTMGAICPSYATAYWRR